MISKELLSEVLGQHVLQDAAIACDEILIWIDEDISIEINIHELAHKCITYAWDNMYEITLRVMGAEIMCLKTGYTKYTILREAIKHPELFDPRYTFKACQWILDNKDKS